MHERKPSTKADLRTSVEQTSCEMELRVLFKLQTVEKVDVVVQRVTGQKVGPFLGDEYEEKALRNKISG